MHSLSHRANTLLTFFGSVAATLAVLTSLTDVVHQSNPVVSASVAELKRFTVLHNSKDQAVITFNLDADLRSVFGWNTKQLFVYLQAEYVTKKNKLNQIVLWDAIIQHPDQANIKLRNHKTKYSFIDQYRGLRGTPLNFTLVWKVMPRVGYLHSGSRSFEVEALPGDYTA